MNLVIQWMVKQKIEWGSWWIVCLWELLEQRWPAQVREDNVKIKPFWTSACAFDKTIT